LGPCQQERDSHDPLGCQRDQPNFLVDALKRGFWEKEKAGGDFRAGSKGVSK